MAHRWCGSNDVSWSFRLSSPARLPHLQCFLFCFEPGALLACWVYATAGEKILVAPPGLLIAPGERLMGGAFVFILKPPDGVSVLYIVKCI
jgi:hypothetical protein